MNDAETLKSRNARVEADKAWEVSWTRRSIIAVSTYIIAASYLTLLNVENFHLHALVPSGAYLLSTLSMPFLKRIWLRHIYKKSEAKP